MNEQMRFDQQPWYFTRSTLLVPTPLIEQFFNSGSYKKVGGLSLKRYFSKLIEDPQLDYKLSFLKSGKWKKEYQKKGQALQRVNFYPDDRDWGRLGAISNATGFSRCYIFVYLLLLDMGVLRLEDGGTNPCSPDEAPNAVVICTVTVNAFRRTMLRILQT